MILYVDGNLFQSPAQVLVNTVNTVGVMGKGIALDFKRLFPEMYEQYRMLCEQKQFKIGMLWLYKSSNKWVLNFPTKTHWRYPSKIEYVETGLKKFASSYEDLGIYSIAFPALGCGNGQLDFETQVQPLMESYLRNLPIEIFIYPNISNTDFVEHLEQKEMKQWLRAQPTALPFPEVWDDLVELLRSKSQFQTIARSRMFKACISNEPRGIEVATKKQRFILQYEDLMAFWQQLRTHGFSMRHIAPGLDRRMSYVTAIFADLDYVKPVHVSDSYDKLGNASVIGLQVLPEAFNRDVKRVPEVAQLSLFDID